MDIKHLSVSNTNSIAATDVSQRRQYPTGGKTNGVVTFYNDGANLVFIAQGLSDVVATLPGLNAAVGAEGNATPVPIGAILPFERAGTHYAVICKAGETASVYCTQGDGR